MPMIRFLLTGSRDNADTVINALHGIEDVEHVEEVDDLTPQMRDDSSSSELTDDDGPGTYYIEVDTPNGAVTYAAPAAIFVESIKQLPPRSQIPPQRCAVRNGARV